MHIDIKMKQKIQNFIKITPNQRHYHFLNHPFLLFFAAGAFTSGGFAIIVAFTLVLCMSSNFVSIHLYHLGQN